MQAAICARYVTDTSPAREIATAQETPFYSEMKPDTRILIFEFNNQKTNCEGKNSWKGTEKKMVGEIHMATAWQRTL